MHCQVCGTESGKYPLCKACNQLREQGLVAKCGQCGRWHRTDAPCPAAPAGAPTGDAPASVAPDTPYLYALRNRLVSANEQGYYTAIQAALPPGYHVYPQINLAAVIERTDHARFCNELFRNVDFLITDGNFTPKIAVEINDRTHYRADRQERDKKVRRICKEAGLPLVTLWTSYGVQPDYIQKRLTEALETPPVRVHHFSQKEETPTPTTVPKKKAGCYIATCVYGSYDCPAVWTLRRYRDRVLAQHWYGRAFIRIYYAISPILVRQFGKSALFHRIWKQRLDKLVQQLQSSGYANTPYSDC